MRLHEYEAADLFETAGIAVPERGVATSPDEAVEIAETIGYPVVLKAQVLVGGRGLAGGIVTASDTLDIIGKAEALLASNIKGIPVKQILVVKKIDIELELYAGITVDGYSGCPVVVVSTEGGVSIENTARMHPEKIVSLAIDPGKELYPYQARLLVQKLGLDGKIMVTFAGMIVRLFHLFSQKEAIIAEINPVAVCADGRLVAVDAVFEIDDSALSRVNSDIPQNPDRIENPLERHGNEIGVTYVDLDGDIGIIASGAGLGMATMDIIGQRLRPANFLETGGGITDDLLYKSMELVMMKEGIRALFINVYGGINPIHEGARGVVRYIREHNLTIPVVAKALGNHQEETWEILRSGGVHVVTDVPTETAVGHLCELLGANGA
ncbi:succinate--CoA ligase subunit beta [Candidatus Latescibacterota bacterium]